MPSNCATCGELIFEGEAVCPACGSLKQERATPSSAALAASPADPDETGVAEPVRAQPRADSAPRPQSQPPSAPAAAAPLKQAGAKKKAKKNAPARFNNKGVAPEHSVRKYIDGTTGAGPMAAAGVILLSVGIISLSIWAVTADFGEDSPPRQTVVEALPEDDVRHDFLVLNSYITDENRLLLILITHNERLPDARCGEIVQFLGDHLVEYRDARTISRRFRSEAHHQQWLEDGGRAEVRMRLNERDRDIYFSRLFRVERR